MFDPAASQAERRLNLLYLYLESKLFGKTLSPFQAGSALSLTILTTPVVGSDRLIFF